MLQGSGVAGLGCSLLPTGSWDFCSCHVHLLCCGGSSEHPAGSKDTGQEPAPALESTAGHAVGSVLLVSAQDFFPLCEKLGWNKWLSAAHHGHGSDLYFSVPFLFFSQGLD